MLSSIVSLIALGFFYDIYLFSCLHSVRYSCCLWIECFAWLNLITPVIQKTISLYIITNFYINCPCMCVHLFDVVEAISGQLSSCTAKTPLFCLYTIPNYVFRHCHSTLCSLNRESMDTFLVTISISCSSWLCVRIIFQYLV